MPIAPRQPVCSASLRCSAAGFHSMSYDERARAWGYVGAEEKKRKAGDKSAKALKHSLAAGERGELGGQLRLSFGGTLGLSGNAKRARAGPAPIGGAVGGAPHASPAMAPATADSSAAATPGAGAGNAAAAEAAGAGSAAAPAPERAPSENAAPVVIELLDDESVPQERALPQPHALQQQRRAAQRAEALPAWAQVRAAGNPARPSASLICTPRRAGAMTMMTAVTGT